MKSRAIHFVYTTLIFLAALWAYQFLYGMGAAGFVLPNDGVRWFTHLRGVTIILGGSIGLALLAEWIGYALSKWLNEAPESAKQFTAMWLRGLVLYFAIAFACAAGLIEAGRTDKVWVPYAAAAGMMLLLLLIRKPLHWVITGRRYKSKEKIPARFIGSLLALLWNLMGLYLVNLLHEQTSFFSAAGVVLVGFGMVIPASVGYIPFAVLEKILSRSSNPIAGWNVSETILYLSWFCFGFIARLAPTTLGRPERWVGLPSDGRSEESKPDESRSKTTE
ncbi:MAG: hypothetical protein KC917_00465 [Candidatus Omnitrophica bacterium]|nr:hypothetical protein [Candidatus Omnitrophota bacterium]